MIKIALTGIAKSGKSTVSDYLCSKTFKELSFAEPLKQLIINLFLIDSKWLYEPELKESVIPEIGVSGRCLLQTIGTELFRNEINKYIPNLLIKNVWINNMKKRLNINTNIVISDCRFPNEYEFLKSQGFIVLKIQRDSIEKINNHISEQGCNYDYIIENNSTKQDLFYKIDKIINEFNKFNLENHYC